MTAATALPDDMTAVPLPDVEAGAAARAWKTVKVWAIDPERVSTPFEQLLAPLDTTEREQAHRKRTDRARRVYAIAHVRLREILAIETGIGHSDIRFAPRMPGAAKPALADEADDLTFNLSHTRGLIVVAVARGREVGVDVEWLGRPVRASALAHRYFTAAELDQFSQARTHTRRQCFLRLWTRREAHAKMTGEGLRRAVANGAPGQANPFAGTESEILELDLAPDHIGAVAVSSCHPPH
jgi:phosphopantetheinyl transferase